MSALLQLEKQALNLPASQREQFALAMWNSLEGQEQFDLEGVQIALDRDRQITEGQVKPIDQDEFRRRTSL